MSKKNILVLFGGRSSEHEVSCVSVTTILSNIDKEKYEVYVVGITKEGRWVLVDSVEEIKDGSFVNSKKQAVLSPDTVEKALYIMEDGKVEKVQIDVAFPVLHGLNGEDGTVQGLFELAGIPYVGCGVLASAVSMDKLYTKIVVDTLGIAQAKYVAVRKEEIEEVSVYETIEEKLGYPVFIKPSNAGSSRGVSKASNRKELVAGLKEASLHDRKILVEETILGREVECAVLGNDEPFASVLGEITPDKEFYDYEAKYQSDSKLTIPAPISETKSNQIREFAKKAYTKIGLKGMSRIDFFVHKMTGDIYLNEINTIPGFTDKSMYPMLMAQSGIDGRELVDKLIEYAIEEFSGEVL